MCLKNLTPFLIFYFLVSSICYGQVRLDDIDLDSVSQRKVRHFIQDQITSDLHNINDIQPSCTDANDLTEFNTNEKTYILEENMQEVWLGYNSLFPTQIHTGHKVSFGLLLKKDPDNICYNTDSINQVDTGQIYYLNLKVLKGLYNLPVVFEIIKIDNIKKIIEFSYIKGNKSQGMQCLQFIDLKNGHTRIIHKTYFKSNSAFRDKYLYPYFHKRLINDFHHGMKKYFNS